MPLFVSAETSFDMKPKTEKSRLRSGGRARMPGPRSATLSPFFTWPCLTQRGPPPRRTSAESIFWSAAGCHVPPTRTKVSKLVVE